MELKQISKWAVIAGTLVIWLIKYLVRPLYPYNDMFRFFLNIAPNLLGSFLIPFGACWFFAGRQFWVARVFRLHSVYDLRIVCLLGFVLLVINEYLQRIPVFGRTFDPFDIISSFIGLAVSYVVFGKLQARKYQAG